MNTKVNPNKVEELAAEFNRLGRVIEDGETGINREISSLIHETNAGYHESYIRATTSEMESLLRQIRTLAASITERLNDKADVLKQAAERYRQDEENAKKISQQTIPTIWTPQPGDVFPGWPGLASPAPDALRGKTGALVSGTSGVVNNSGIFNVTTENSRYYYNTAFGNIMGTGNNIYPFGFTGYQYDPRMGLYYPSGNLWSPNAQINKNPAMYLDPIGQWRFNNEVYDIYTIDTNEISYLDCLAESATGKDAYFSYLTGGAEQTTVNMAEKIYHTTITSSSRVEAYRKLMDQACRSERIVGYSKTIKAVGKWGGVGLGVVSGTMDIYSDMNNPNYTIEDKKKAAAIDVLATGISIGVGLISLPASAPILVSLGVVVALNALILYGSKTAKKEWIGNK